MQRIGENGGHGYETIKYSKVPKSLLNMTYKIYSRHLDSNQV